MSDPRVSNLAKTLVHYSTKVQQGDKVVIRGFPLEPIASPLIIEVFREVLKAGGHPYFLVDLEDSWYFYLQEASEAQLLMPDIFMNLIAEEFDVDIRISCTSNRLFLTNVKPESRKLVNNANSDIWDRIRARSAAGDLRWVATIFPAHSFAQAAEMSLVEFQEFFYKATYTDTENAVGKWTDVKQDQERLVSWLRDKSEVHISGDGIDLEMSIAGRTFVNCSGEANMPDGEIFTGPVEDSVKGRVKFSYPCIYQGIEVDGVELVFEDGKVVQASAEKNEDFLLGTLDTDEGARYIGEFGIGTNYEIERFTRTMLFDEKIGGTIHLALGNGYPISGSVNKSAIHWDLLTDMRDHGKIIVDGELFYESGEFKV